MTVAVAGAAMARRGRGGEGIFFDQMPACVHCGKEKSCVVLFQNNTIVKSRQDINAPTQKWHKANKPKVTKDKAMNDADGRRWLLPRKERKKKGSSRGNPSYAFSSAMNGCLSSSALVGRFLWSSVRHSLRNEKKLSSAMPAAASF